MLGLEFSRNQKLALCAVVGLIAIGLSLTFARNGVCLREGGVVLYEPSRSEQTRMIAADSDPAPDRTSSEASSQVVFHVAGCVRSPNVYSLPQGKRVVDAIRVAGGAKPHADVQSINLAARIEDGSRIYLPAIGESQKTPAQGGASGAAPSGRSTGKLRTPGEGVVHINSATCDELQRLPGVGPVTAQKILDYRAQIVRFSSPEQLMDVKGIGPKKFERMRVFVAL